MLSRCCVFFLFSLSSVLVPVRSGCSLECAIYFVRSTTIRNAALILRIPSCTLNGDNLRAIDINIVQIVVSSILKRSFSSLLPMLLLLICLSSHSCRHLRAHNTNQRKKIGSTLQKYTDNMTHNHIVSHFVFAQSYSSIIQYNQLVIEDESKSKRH